MVSVPGSAASRLIQRRIAMIGTVVTLRNEEEVSVKRGYIGDQQVSVDPADMKLDTQVVTERIRYSPRPDAQLDKILSDTDGDPVHALSSWFAIAGPRLPSGPGVRLIPGALKVVLNLSLRQIYVDAGLHLWEIGEPFSRDEHFKRFGTITRRLL
tara:strand:- start:439 stop:903 length:465 start_codon:yes stop_codon:yes gene_type:complete